jgi:outer membrane lipoprotein-sorting protein
VNGQLTTLDPKRNYNGGSIFSYTITPGHELLEVELTMTPGQEIDLDIFETKYDLLSNSEFEIVPRTDAMIPMPFVVNDATLIKTKLKR